VDIKESKIISRFGNIRESAACDFCSSRIKHQKNYKRGATTRKYCIACQAAICKKCEQDVDVTTLSAGNLAKTF